MPLEAAVFLPGLWPKLFRQWFSYGQTSHWTNQIDFPKDVLFEDSDDNAKALILKLESILVDDEKNFYKKGGLYIIVFRRNRNSKMNNIL